MVFDPDEDCDEPYIKVGPEFPDDLVMSFIKQELGLPDNIRELLDKQNLDWNKLHALFIKVLLRYFDYNYCTI